MLGALPEYRSITSDINSSILANRLRALFAFITTPLVVAFSEREQVFGRWKYTTKTIKTIRPSSASERTGVMPVSLNPRKQNRQGGFRADVDESSNAGLFGQRRAYAGCPGR